MHHVVHEEDVQRAHARTKARGLVLLGILHTHPLSRAAPGPGDMAGYASGPLMFIYSDIYEELRAFRVRNGRAVEQGVRIE
jgi:proteasome lid subunit RPN8/RPN11